MNGSYIRQRALIVLGSLFFAFAFSVSAVEVNPAKNPMERLKEGNQRYINSETVCHEDWSVKRSALLENQKPFAVIVACADSRVPPEIIFDQSLGKLFVVRVAGNIVDDFAIGSIEYGVSVLGANLVLVLGHSGCGAVDAALKGMKFDNHIQEVVNAIQPAVVATKGQEGNLLEIATKANVKNVEEKLKSSKPLLAKLIENGTLIISGGYYHLESGKVEFLDQENRKPQYLYKIVSPEEWKESQLKNQVINSQLDQNFIHLATEDQLAQIAQKYWEGKDYIILKLDSNKISGRLVNETNPGGTTLYYHLYEGTIPLSAVIDATTTNASY